MIDYTNREARERRLDTLLASIDKILTLAATRGITEHRDSKGRGRVLAATVTMFSGGNDSTVLAHIMRTRTDYFAHANTGIGIEQTREFVRQTCSSWNVPLIERHPTFGRRYEDYVLKHGFPGPGRHDHIFNRIKGSPFEQINKMLCPNPYRQRVLFVAGRRFTESARRTGLKIPLWERRSSIVWVSPLRGWTALDLNTYRMRFPDCPTNQIAAEIGMSGECLCGAFAKPGELETLRAYPPALSVVEQIEELQEMALAAGVPPGKCVWGRRPVDRPCGEGCNL